jgi:hypothetical protein
MIFNRAKSIVSISKNAVTSIVVNKCNKSIGIRAFASSSSLKNSADKVNSTTSVTSKLLRNLKSEYEAQKEMVKEQAEELEPRKVLENFSNFFKENNWSIEHAEDSTLVILKRRDELLQADVLLKFDLVEVFNELYEDNVEEEFDSEETVEESESSTEIENRVDEEMQFVTLPFSLEIKRDSIPEKTLLFDCVLEGDESENGIIIENVAVMSTDTSKLDKSYSAPNYSQLDETLQENFEEFVDSLVASDELMGFVKNYSVASEAGLYQKWLKDVRSILKN